MIQEGDKKFVPRAKRHIRTVRAKYRILRCREIVDQTQRLGQFLNNAMAAFWQGKIAGNNDIGALNNHPGIDLDRKETIGSRHPSTKTAVIFGGERLVPDQGWDVFLLRRVDNEICHGFGRIEYRNATQFTKSLEMIADTIFHLLRRIFVNVNDNRRHPLSNSGLNILFHFAFCCHLDEITNNRIMGKIGVISPRTGASDYQQSGKYNMEFLPHTNLKQHIVTNV